MSERILDVVRKRYASVARSGLSSEQRGVRAVAEAFGYTPDELASIPAEANMGLSCGNPTAMASLREGETIVDLGSGGGLDVFLAADKVGSSGRAIGIDMTPEMIDLARRNAAKRLDRGGADNVEFHQATIDAIPLADATADVVISNCVINLAPDKPAVFREIARILRPGGRLAVSDIALRKPLPPEISADVTAYVGCIAGAISVEEYQKGLLDAGFEHVEILDTGADLNAYSAADSNSACCAPAPVSISSGPRPTNSAQASCCAPSSAEVDERSRLAGLLAKYNVNDYAASVRVFAVRATDAER